MISNVCVWAHDNPIHGCGAPIAASTDPNFLQQQDIGESFGGGEGQKKLKSLWNPSKALEMLTMLTISRMIGGELMIGGQLW